MARAELEKTAQGANARLLKKLGEETARHRSRRKIQSPEWWDGMSVYDFLLSIIIIILVD